MLSMLAVYDRFRTITIYMYSSIEFPTLQECVAKSYILRIIITGFDLSQIYRQPVFQQKFAFGV